MEIFNVEKSKFMIDNMIARNNKRYTLLHMFCNLLNIHNICIYLVNFCIRCIYSTNISVSMLKLCTKIMEI